MPLFKSYWTVEGISPSARDAAIRAADANGEELGEWISRLIRKVSEAEREAFAPANDSSENGAENDAAIGEAEDAEDADEEKVETAAPDADEEAVVEPPDIADKREDGEDDKLSSIERAMLQSRAAGDAGSR